MNSFTKKELIVILVVAFIVIFSLGFKFFIKGMLKPHEMDMDLSSTLELLEEDNGDTDELENKDIEIMIHISGQVYKPGIISLQSGKRLVDAVELAGGLKKDADIDRINLLMPINT